ncbi:MAG TPA: SBBP repeat-containing protein, partial [Methanolinea sp.]|nr:SBBP repeat-containing protein [Methanolinea sp.]
MRSKGLACFVILSLVLVSVISASQVPFPVDPSGESTLMPVRQVDPAQGQDQGRVQGGTQAIPLQFVKNAGQSDDGVEYIVLTDGGSLFFAPGGVSIKLVTPDGQTFRTTSLGYSFYGADPDPEMTGLFPRESTVNFLLGKDPSSWYTDVPTYGAILYRDLYPGIDLEYCGTSDGIKSVFTVAPGASPDSIIIEYRGVSGLSLTDEGALRIQTPAGDLLEYPPVAYQVIDGQVVPRDVSFALHGNNRVGFSTGSYDPEFPLIIDPVMKYGVYLRGVGLAYGRSVAVSPDGSAFVTGETFPAPYSLQGESIGPLGGGMDVIVVKVNPEGTVPLYVTYIGGSGNETGYGIKVDASGYAYVTGVTDSQDFPVKDALQGYLAGDTDAFALKLSPDGSNPVFSTYLGGTRPDSGNDLALDRFGNILIAGDTSSFSMPDIDHSTHTVYGGNQDAFVLKLTGDGKEIVYSEFIGGNQKDAGNGVAVDRDGNAYVTGETSSKDFPVKDAYQSSLSGGTWSDAFITKVSPGGETFVYSTYLGGPQIDVGHAIAVDSYGHAHVTGSTLMSVFPVKNAFQPVSGGAMDAFYSYLSADGRELLYSTYLGGSCNDWGTGITTDVYNTIFITGSTASLDFPLVDPFQPRFGNGDPKATDAFVAKFCPFETRPDYLTYLGGTGSDNGASVATDGVDGAYITGFTDSPNFPSSDPYPPAFEPKGQGGFLFVLRDDACTPPCELPVAGFAANPASGHVPLTVNFTDTSTGNPVIWSWDFGDGETSPDQNPVHTYTAEGTYTVTLTVTNECGPNSTTKQEYIHVLPPCVPPVANFSANPTEGYAPLNVTFTDESTGVPTEWFWSFGDGATSTDRNPFHTYNLSGTYTVTLTVTNDCGSNSTTRQQYIHVLPPCVPPVANFSANPTE